MLHTPDLNLSPILELLTDGIKPAHLAELIDEVLFEYALFNITRPSEAATGVDQKIIWMRQMRNALKEMR